MVFSSPHFLFLFLPIVCLLHAITPIGGRNALLLAASLLFYVWGEAAHLWLLLALIAFNWLAGLAIDHADAGRKALLATAVTVDLSALVWFKYAGFLAASLGLSTSLLAGIGLPLGISFFVFHTISYVVDVARRVAPAQRDPVAFALYIAFFPQLIAGPIIRYHDVAALLVRRNLSHEDVAAGLERFVVGLAKKVLLANTLGATADQIFTLPADGLSVATAWLGLACYTLQIYFDFSGYSDMAIGLARVFGFRFLENFNYPYIARSMQDFWRRWHISLTNWFRDYVYIPLGGNRRGAARTYVNLCAIFLLCGLWHGASWNFLVWGALHGFFLAAERAGLGRVLIRLPRPARHLYVLLVASIAWVFFRADTLSAATDYIKILTGVSPPGTTALPLSFYLDRETLVALACGAVGATPIASRLTRDWRARAGQSLGVVAADPRSDNLALAGARTVVLLTLACVSVIELAGSTYNPFIYFRF